MLYIISIALFYIMRKVTKYLSSTNKRNYIVDIYIVLFSLIIINYGCVFYYGTAAPFVRDYIPDYSENGIARIFSLIMAFVLIFTCIPSKKRITTTDES